MSLNPPPLNQNETSLQPFDALPDELLLPIFQYLHPLKRSLLLSICKRWNDTLLLNHSLWNSLILGKDLSFEESLSIFRLFNSRSGYRLRHVCLGAQVPDDEGLRKLSEELGKSSDSLRVLGLVSEFPGDVIMKQAKMVCPKLNTLQIMGPREYHPRAMSILFSFRQRMGIRDLEDEKLKYLRCGNLSLVGEEYKDYLSTMESLCIRGTSSLTALRSILMASQSTLNELDLLAWAAIPSPFSTTGKGKLRLKSLRNLRLPFLPAALNDLDDVMEVEGKLNRLGSSLSTLVKFDSRAVKHLELYLFAEEVPFQVVLLRNLEEETAIQMQQHHSIGELTLWCPNSKTGGKKHLDFLLKTLLSSRSEVEIDFESLVLNEED